MIMENGSIERFATTAFELGPFFFSILFMLVIVGMAHKFYRKVNLRSNPEASAAEKKCYQIYFVSSFVAGIILVFISVGWWMYTHGKKHTLRGAIVGLGVKQILIPVDDDLYMREHLRDIDGIKFVDKHFVIVRDSPFNTGQRIEFRFFPSDASLEQPKPEKLYVSISGKDFIKFQLDKNGEDYILKPIE
jgi:cbb3-type cytochrome oxidase subunit 3